MFNRILLGLSTVLVFIVFFSLVGLIGYCFLFILEKYPYLGAMIITCLILEFIGSLFE